MRSYNPLPIAARNVVYYRRYSLSLSGVLALCFMALATFRLYMDDVNNTMVATWSHRLMLGDLIVEKLPSPASNADFDPLEPADQELVEALFGAAGSQIAAWSRFLNVQGTIENGPHRLPFIGLAYDPDGAAALRGASWGWDAIAGTPINSAAHPQVLIGKRLGARLGCSPGPIADHLGGLGYPARLRPFSCAKPAVTLRSVGGDGGDGAIETPVTGIFDGMFHDLDALTVALPLTSAQELLRTRNVSYYAVKLSDGDPGAFAQRLAAAAAARGLELNAAPWPQHRLGERYRRTMAVLETFATFITAILIAVAALIVFASAVKMISERTREIGILRALGFRPFYVLATLGCEGLMIAGAGSALGGLLTTLVTLLINTLKVEYFVAGMTQPVLFTLSYAPTVYLTAAAGLSAVCIVTMVATGYGPVAGPLAAVLRAH